MITILPTEGSLSCRSDWPVLPTTSGSVMPWLNIPKVSRFTSVASVVRFQRPAQNPITTPSSLVMIIGKVEELQVFPPEEPRRFIRERL